MTDSDYGDSLAPLANTPAEAECLPHNQEQAARVIGLYENANKTEFIRFKQVEIISTFSEISRPVHMPQQQYLIYWKQ